MDEITYLKVEIWEIGCKPDLCCEDAIKAGKLSKSAWRLHITENNHEYNQEACARVFSDKSAWVKSVYSILRRVYNSDKPQFCDKRTGAKLDSVFRVMKKTGWEGENTEETGIKAF